MIDELKINNRYDELKQYISSYEINSTTDRSLLKLGILNHTHKDRVNPSLRTPNFHGIQWDHWEGNKNSRF